MELVIMTRVELGLLMVEEECALVVRRMGVGVRGGRGVRHAEGVCK